MAVDAGFDSIRFPLLDAVKHVAGIEIGNQQLGGVGAGPGVGVAIKAAQISMGGVIEMAVDEPSSRRGGNAGGDRREERGLCGWSGSWKAA